MNYARAETHLLCPICQARLAKSDDLFCPSHKVAFENIRQRYVDWVNAYGSVTKERYLELLASNVNSGEWVIEVATYLLNEGKAQMI